MEFCDRLRILREKREMTREELGTVFGLSYSAIAKYESGERTPDFDLLKKIAQFFRVSTDYLIGFTDDPGVRSSAQTPLFISEGLPSYSEEKFFVRPRESVMVQLSPQEQETYLEMCRSPRSPFRGRDEIGKTSLSDDTLIALIRVYEMVKENDDRTGRVPRKRNRSTQEDGNK